jgi:hypothetical protein
MPLFNSTEETDVSEMMRRFLICKSKFEFVTICNAWVGEGFRDRCEVSWGLFSDLVGVGY